MRSIIDFSALDGLQLLGVLSLMDEEGLPDHADIERCVVAYTCRVDPRQPARACGCLGEADVLRSTIRILGGIFSSL